MQAVAYNTATTEAVGNIATFLLTTLQNFAPMLLTIFAVMFIFRFLSRKLSGR